MLFLIWTLVLLVALGLYFRQIYTRFSRYGVKNRPVIPFFGNIFSSLFRREHIYDNVYKLFYEFPEERFVGNFQLTVPILLLRDLELAKKVTVKDFEYFLDHTTFVDTENDSLFGRNLFSLKGQEWKDMRATLSPAFTSSKIRLMVPFMVEVGDQMIKSLENQIKASGNGYVDLEAKDLTTRYANDVIASCAFGLKVDSHFDRQNQFYVQSNKASNFSFVQILKFFLFGTFPKLMKATKMSLFSGDIKRFFRSLVLDNMQEREEKNIVRPDMIHLLMEAKKGKLTHSEEKTTDASAGFATVEESAVGKKEINRVNPLLLEYGPSSINLKNWPTLATLARRVGENFWTDDDLVAQAFLFLFAGFETVSSIMTFLLHELAVNPDVQEKLVKEIKENDAKNNGKFDYNSIQKMVYLDMVVAEVLRKWPPVPALDRLCVKDYNLGKPNDKATQDYIVRKNEVINIPVWPFHRSPEYFPDPDRFDPERFSEENKHKINPFTYMPFGIGPRNCIGSRFALCEVKVMTYQLLKNMEISPAAKTKIPAQLARDSFNIRLDGGSWVRFRIRS